MSKKENNNIVEIKAIFPVEDSNYLIVHLASFKWDFSQYGLVELCFPNEKVRMKYIGCGEQKGNPVLKLQLVDPRYKSVIEIAKLIECRNERIYIERVTM